MRMKTLIPIALIALCGCATVNDAKELRVGMTADEIHDKIGTPDRKLIDRDRDIDVYTLKKYGKGWQWTFGILSAGLSCLAPGQEVYIEMQDGKLVRVR